MFDMSDPPRYLSLWQNFKYCWMNSLDSLRAFVELNEHPRLGIALAPYHIQGLGASVEEAIEICGKQLLFFYAWQRAGDTGQLPGTVEPSRSDPGRRDFLDDRGG